MASSLGTFVKQLRNYVWLCVAIFLVAMARSPVAAQSEAGLDWRKNLDCPANYQVRDGVQYCTGFDEKGQIVHVVVIDLAAPSIRFEYILPKGYSDGHTGLAQCRDPNRPAYGGPAGGCYIDSNQQQYPSITLDQAVARAVEIKNDPPLAALIDADYASNTGNHGAEGLMVVQHNRLDGAANCDDDFNAALRPWLGLGEKADPATNLILVEIDRLTSDGAPIPDWLWTGIGGGPMLVEDGVVYGGAEDCRGQRTLSALEPVVNCHLATKTPSPPKTESYNSGSCRTAPHTAAGFSPDRRWLFLAISSGDDTPLVLAHFMAGQLGVVEALKFDGGGSSQFWVAGQPDLALHVDGGNRPLTNFLAVYADEGQGLALPHMAANISNPTLYLILDEGEEGTINFTLRNEGAFTWRAEDGVALARRPALDSPFSQPELFALPHDVAPGETVSWSFPADASGIHTHRFQMAQDGEYFGQTTQYMVIVVPQAMQDQREELEQMIAEAQAQGEQELEELAQRVQEWLLNEGRNLLERLLSELAAKAQAVVEEIAQAVLEAVSSSCAGVILLPGALGATCWLAGRRRDRKR